MIWADLLEWLWLRCIFLFFIFGFGLICWENFVFFIFGANFCWKEPKIVLIGAQKLFEWGPINFFYLLCFFFFEPAGAMAPFGSQWLRLCICSSFLHNFICPNLVKTFFFFFCECWNLLGSIAFWMGEGFSYVYIYILVFCIILYVQILLDFFFWMLEPTG